MAMMKKSQELEDLCVKLIADARKAIEEIGGTNNSPLTHFIHMSSIVEIYFSAISKTKDSGKRLNSNKRKSYNLNF